jgi:hypothetical protein
VATRYVRLAPVDICPTPTSFERIAAKASSRQSSCFHLVVFRTGSIVSTFFDEFSAVLDRLSTFNEQLQIVGDYNVHIERQSDAYTIELVDLLAAYGLSQHVDATMHDARGIIDIVCSRLPSLVVDVAELGLSDHRLLNWTIDLRRPPPMYVTSKRRRWPKFDDAGFGRDLFASAICNPNCYAGLAVLHDVTIKDFLDRHALLRCLTITITTIDFMRRLQIERQRITMASSIKTNKNGRIKKQL